MASPSQIPLISLPSPDPSDHSDIEDALCSDIRAVDSAKFMAGLKVTDDASSVCYERQLGDNELAYYLPSRANGVNDMYVLFSFLCRSSSHLHRTPGWSTSASKPQNALAARRVYAPSGLFSVCATRF